MSYEPYPDTLHRVRAAEFEREAFAAGLTRRAHHARRLELAAQLLDRLARRLESRAGASRARML
ncbi:hypothetical protein [Jiangella endophytica]|uniref:hypothetical protein n=1 Tax=Jiangella endophytica TaxID=1623398 RepID=UPI000E344BD2|nr:hypothetical protein [Jiangella endophytica]